MKKYYLIAIAHGSGVENGITNIGFVADQEHPLNNTVIKDHVKNRPEFKFIQNLSLVVTSIYQFENEQEYINFWK